MGYTTKFEGRFTVDPPLRPEHKAYLEAFAGTRRMRRDEAKTARLPDPVREAVGLPVGPAGAYFVGGGGLAGQAHDSTITDYNTPPPGQPGLWCKWVPGGTDEEDGRPEDRADCLGWSGEEKFYDYAEWLAYLVNNFLDPWGYSLSGTVVWWGENRTDVGSIQVAGETVSVRSGYPLPVPTPAPGHAGLASAPPTEGFDPCI